MTKQIKQNWEKSDTEITDFIEWIEEEDRQDWEIERYVEDLLKAQKKELIEGIEFVRKEYLIKAFRFSDEGQCGDSNGGKCYQANKNIKFAINYIDEIIKRLK